MQDINLYRFLPRNHQSPIDLRVFLMTYGVLVFVLFFSFFVGLLHRHHLSFTLKTETASLASLRDKVSSLSSSYARSGNTFVLTHDDTALACRVKFSLYMEAIATAIVPGAWLTNIHFSENGKKVDMTGLAFKVMDVQSFLTRLNEIPMFSGLNFQIQSLQEQAGNPNSDKPDEGSINFVIGTTG